MVHGLHVTVPVQHLQPRSQGFFSKYPHKLLHKSVKTACSSPDNVLIGHDSGIQEMFACGIRIQGKCLLVESGFRESVCLWNPDSGKVFACGIRIQGKCLLVESGFRENVCSWNPDSGKMFACGMRDPGLSNPAYSWRKPEFR